MSQVALTPPAAGAAIRWLDNGQTCPPSCARNLKVDSQVNLEASLGGYTLDSWTGPCSGTNPRCSFSVAAGGAQNVGMRLSGCPTGRVLLDGTKCVTLTPWGNTDIPDGTSIAIKVRSLGKYISRGSIPFSTDTYFSAEDSALQTRDLLQARLFRPSPPTTPAYNQPWFIVGVQQRDGSFGVPFLLPGGGGNYYFESGGGATGQGGAVASTDGTGFARHPQEPWLLIVPVSYLMRDAPAYYTGLVAGQTQELRCIQQASQASWLFVRVGPPPCAAFDFYIVHTN